MHRFALTLRTDRTPRDVLARLLSAEAHTDAVPLTVVRADGPLDRPGARLVARTSLGPIGFDDPMTVERADLGPDGGVVVLAKTGRVVTGRVAARVRPLHGGAALDWAQDIELPLLPRAVDPAVAMLARLAYRAALRRIIG